MNTMKFSSVAGIVVAVTVMASGAAVAQRGGGRGGAPGMPGGAFPLSRMESLQENFKLDGDKKKAVKALLDETNRSAAPVREALLTTHAALGAAVQAGATQDAVDAAARAYGEQAAAMARIEMEAIAKVIAIADPELQNPQAIQAAFFMARGMFLKSGKWDEIPEQNVPGY
jgi:hypothetical protein